MLDEGDKAPDFSVPDTSGKTVKRSDFKGKKLVLYFYPKDDTPGCTVEACSFRDHLKKVQQKGAVVLGVSADDMASHQKFTQKYSLPFPLLADTDKKICNAYGVWGPKTMMGKTFNGIHRTTFIIDEAGVIKKVFRNVKPEGHVDEVLAAL